MSIGSKIYELRTAHNLSQGDLADRLEVSRQSVSKWETDAAVPDLDKLIRLCDVFGVTLDELTGRAPRPEPSPTVAVAERTAALTPQRIIGYILLTVSLIGGILVILLARDSDDLYLLIPLLISIFVCSLICLFVKRHVGYWCTWAAFAPISLLTPQIVWLPILSVIGCTQAIFYTVMAVIANKLLQDIIPSVKRSRTVAIILGWIACIAVYLTSPLTTGIMGPSQSFNFFAIILIAYAAVALLLPYTVCYVRSARKR